MPKTIKKETLHNPDFNRVQFEAVKNEAGLNRFVMTPTKWIEQMNAKGIVSKSGRYGGGTYAHSDIALSFASWISPEFQLYITASTTMTPCPKTDAMR